MDEQIDLAGPSSCSMSRAPGRKPPRTSDIAWVRDFWSAMRPFSSRGTYVNFLTEDAEEERVRAAYGSEIYTRLARIKARYDPDNLFRSNQNIRPAQPRRTRRRPQVGTCATASG
jgi:Berberine and berberine like